MSHWQKPIVILKQFQIQQLGTNKTVDQKNRALIAATRWIDSFVYFGDRCDQGQALKFPRNNYQVDDVELSCTTIPKISSMHSMN